MWQEMNSSEQVAALREGKIDIGFLHTPSEHHDLEAREIARAEQEIKQWQEITNRRRQQEAEQQAQHASLEAGQVHSESRPGGRIELPVLTTLHDPGTGDHRGSDIQLTADGAGSSRASTVKQPTRAWSMWPTVLTRTFSPKP